jgi:hypothetical protein
MNDTSTDRPLLGAVLVADRAVDEADVYCALREQIETREPIGEILVGLGRICRPQLDRALARQAGLELGERTGFGTGLRLEIERRHEIRRALFDA